MFNVAEITQLQHEMVARWHEQEIDNPYEGLESVVCMQHGFNFLLWHEEDIARSPDVGDQRIATVKRAIDGYNQKRNDWIEKVDDWISGEIEATGVQVADHAPLNTETPGSAVDRLSIMSLRLYHMREQLDRTDVTREHLESVERKIAVCLMQHDDLSNSLQALIDDIAAGKKTASHLSSIQDVQRSFPQSVSLSNAAKSGLDIVA